MDGLGFERFTEQLSENEWHVYFYRAKIDEGVTNKFISWCQSELVSESIALNVV